MSGGTPAGVHTHVELDRVGRDVWLTVKGKVHVMDSAEAMALAAALQRIAAEIPPPQQDPAPAEPEPPEDEDEEDEQSGDDAEDEDEPEDAAAA